MYKCWDCLGTNWVPSWIGALMVNGDPLPDWLPPPKPCNTCTDGRVTEVDLIRIALTSDDLFIFQCDGCSEKLVTASTLRAIPCPECSGKYRKIGDFAG